MSSSTTNNITQIDFSVESIGKRDKDSKRRIRWVYGVNGQQHEVEFTWSIASGKQEVLVDGTSVLFGRKKGSSVFSEILTKLGEQPHLQLVCCRTKPTKAPRSFQCYELLINDKPFFTYPRANSGGGYQEEDSFGPGDLDYTGPMSILDIVFPGKYYGNEGSATQQYELSKEDREKMSFHGNEQPAPPPSKDLMGFSNHAMVVTDSFANDTSSAMVVVSENQNKKSYADPNLLGDQQQTNALVPHELPPQNDDLLGMMSTEQPQQAMVASSQQPSNPYGNDLLL